MRQEMEIVCQVCGTKNNSGYPFCMHCGSPLKGKDPLVLKDVLPLKGVANKIKDKPQPGVIFADDINTDKKCSYCEQVSSKAAMFCPTCGAMLGGQDELLPGIQVLKVSIQSASSLLICDPYFFYGEENETVEQFASTLGVILPLSSLSKVTVIHNGGKKTGAHIRAFQNFLNDHSIPHKIIKSGKIHDRIWIINNDYGYLVGTSLNGIGKRLSFIVPLPDADVRYFLDFVSELI